MTGFATVPTHNPGETFPSADWNIVAANLNSGGVMRMLADTTLGVAAASIDFTSIPQTFAHLELVVYARSDTAATNTSLAVRFNGDSAANYDYQQVNAAGTTATEAEGLGQTLIVIGLIPANTAGANLFGSADAVIPHYTGTANNKAFTSLYVAKLGTTTGSVNVGLEGGGWRSSVAITRVTLLPVSGNLAAGTRATLYGLPL